MASVIVEYAKSSRSACKHCKLELAKGEVRIGIVGKAAGGFDMTKWHHFKCISESMTKVPDISRARGFCSLKASDQTLLKDLFEKGVTEEFEVTRKRVRTEESDKESSPKRLTETRYDRKLWEEMLASFEPSQYSSIYKGSSLPSGWKSFASIIVNEVENGIMSERIAAFDFDGCLVNTNVKRVGADAWSLMYKTIPERLKTCHEEGFKLVVFTNESNIDRWTKSRQKAIDSKIGRLNGFIRLVKVPMQVIISCAKEGSGDPCRKPAPGMWEFMERHLNGGVQIDKSSSFYVGDAAGRPGDHSEADIAFAQAVGIPFIVPEDYVEERTKTT